MKVVGLVPTNLQPWPQWGTKEETDMGIFETREGGRKRRQRDMGYCKPLGRLIRSP